jgi:hypothetical protein
MNGQAVPIFKSAVPAMLACILIGNHCLAQQSISINFWNAAASNAANNTVDSGEVAGVVPVDGQFWNNIALPGGTITPPDSQPMQMLINNSGANAATFTSTLESAFVGFTNVSAVVPTNGDRDMMTSYIAWNNVTPLDTGTLTISGLGPAFTSGGYHVLVYSDNGDNTRTHTITIGGQTQVVVDDATFNGSLNEANGVGGDNENYAVFQGLTASSFDITMNSSIGRGAVNGLQIVAGDYFPPRPELVIDRLTGTIDLVNETAAAIPIKGYTITSGQGALNQAAWTSIANNYDLSGSGLVDNDENWIIFSDPSSLTDLSEGTFQGGSIATQSTVRLGGPGTWIGNPIEDLRMELLLEDGSLVRPTVSFVGNGGNRISAADLDANGVVDAADWLIFRGNLNGPDLSSSLSAAQLFQAGDLNGDFDVDRLDFLSFKQAYIAATSPAAFALAVQGVPEPESLAIVLVAAGLLVAVYAKQRIRQLRPLAVRVGHLPTDIQYPSKGCIMNKFLFPLSVVALWAMAGSVQAVVVVNDDFEDGVIDTSQWVVLDVNSAEVNETDGRLVLSNSATNFGRPYLATVDGWDPAEGAITFTGTVNLPLGPEAGGNASSFALWTRSSGAYDTTGAPNGGGVIGSGVRFSFWLGGGANPLGVFTKEDGTWPWTNLITSATVNSANLTLVSGDWDVLVTDNGEVASMTLTNVADPNNFATVSLATTFVPAVTRNAIAFGNAGASWDNITIDVDSAPPLSLVVDTSTGAVRMQNNSGAAIEIDYYEIRSASGSLVASGGASLGDYNGDGSTDAADYTVWRDNLGAADESAFAPGTGNGGGVDASDYVTWRTNFGATGGAGGWLSFADQDLEGSGPPGDGLGWEEGDNVDSTLLFETILAGGYSLADGADLSLGNAFVPGGMQDLIFEYHVAGTGASFTAGSIEYVSSASLAASAVPEPSTAAMAALILLVCIASRRTLATRRGASLLVIGATTSIVAWAVPGSTAWAAVYNDRVYRMGDDSLEDAANAFGGVVGSGPSSVAPGFTLDSGEPGDPSGSFLDLVQTGDPIYVNVSTLGGGRPGATPGSRGIRFDGVDDRLNGIPLNRPDELADRVSTAFGTVYPFDYTNIVTSGMQMWVYPDASRLGSPGSPSAFQSIVFDTNFSGGPAINAIGQWTQTNSDHIAGAGGVTPVPASVAVPAGNTWYHVMHHTYRALDSSGSRVVPGSGTTFDFTSVMYVDGVAVSANNDPIPLGSNRDLVIGAAQVTVDSYDHYFGGVVDDLEMYVYGDNTSSGGMNYGTFSLFSDNAWIANEIATSPSLQGTLMPGDANKDGIVNGTGLGNPNTDDVAAFIAGWGSTNMFQGAHNRIFVGDWLTWERGDFNLDGVVDLLDWHILTESHPNGASLSLADLLNGSAVPEPGGLVIVSLALAATVAVGRYRTGRRR